MNRFEWSGEFVFQIFIDTENYEFNLQKFEIILFHLLNGRNWMKMVSTRLNFTAWTFAVFMINSHKHSDYSLETNAGTASHVKLWNRRSYVDQITKHTRRSAA